MIAEHLEPKGLDRNTPPADPRLTDKWMREDAICGSIRLLFAIQKAGLRP